MSSPDLANPADALDHAQEAVLGALDRVLAPLAKLCVAKGIRIHAVEEQVRRAFLDAARNAHPTPSASRLTSRLSASTGLTRREVARLEDQTALKPASRRSPASEVFTRWLTDPALRGPDNKVLPLPRQGSTPSFESLAQSVTRDVHARTLLDELCRLGLATHDRGSDTVQVLREAFVPQGDWPRMLAFLGDNVGDHLSAAVANALQDGKQQIEQAIFVDELSAEALAQARDLMTHQWRSLLAAVTPQLETLIDADRAAGRAQDHSLRIGLFTWSQPIGVAPDPSPSTPQESPP